MEERSVFGGMMPGITGSPAVRERSPSSPPGLESDGCSGRGIADRRLRLFGRICRVWQEPPLAFVLTLWYILMRKPSSPMI